MAVTDAPEIQARLARLRDLSAQVERNHPAEVDRERRLVQETISRLQRDVDALALPIDKAVRKLDLHLELTRRNLERLRGLPPAASTQSPVETFQSLSAGILREYIAVRDEILKGGNQVALLARAVDDTFQRERRRIAGEVSFGMVSPTDARATLKVAADGAIKRLKEILLPPARAPSPAPRPALVPAPAPSVPTMPAGASYPTQLPPPITALRDYQQQALDRWLQARHGSITIATGGGKTAIAIAAMIRLKVPTAVFLPTIALLEQWYGTIRRAGAEPGRWYEAYKEIRPVTCFTYHSAILPGGWEQLQKFQFFVFDETDQVGADEWSRLLDVASRAPYAMGLTATLEDGRFKDQRVLATLPRVYNMSIASGVRIGAIARTVPVPIPVELGPGEREAYDRMSDRLTQLYHSLQTSDPQVLGAMAKRDFKAREALNLMGKRKRLLADTPAKIQAVINILKGHPGERVLLFSESIASIEQLCEVLTKQGFRCAIRHSKLGARAQREALENWGKTHDVLLAVSQLNRGIDVPEVGVGIIIASSKRMATVIQRIGRLVRIPPDQPGKVAKIYVVYAAETMEDKLYPLIKRLVESDE